MSAWAILALAVLTEISWALSLKWATAAGTWAATAVPVVLSFATMGMLALAMRGLAAGTAYSIWSGLGAVGVVVGGVVLFGERVGTVQACFMALTVIGVIGTRYFAS